MNSKLSKAVLSQLKINRELAHVTQKQVADDLGCTIQLVSAFEQGRTNNAVMLMYYIEKGWCKIC